MNALEFIETNIADETYTNKIYPHYSFGSITFNSIDLWIAYDRRTMKPLMINITKLIKAFKCGLKSTARAGTNSFVLYNREQIESRGNDFTEIKGKGTQQYKGWYASVKWLDRICFSVAGFNGADWFDGREEWYGEMYYGHVYLVQPPEYRDTNVFKLGKTGQTEREMKKRWQAYVRTAKEDGINGLDILGLAAVKNTSDCESDALAFFKCDNRVHFMAGASGKETEYFEVIDDDANEAADVAASIFVKMCSEFKDRGKLQDIDDAIQIYDSGTNVFHYECHKN